MLSDLSFSLQITAPIFIIIGLGFQFKRMGWINDDFAQMGSALVFKVTLPCLLLVKLAETDFTHGLPVSLVGYGVLATVVIFVLLDSFATSFVKERGDKGVLVQGAFRSNLAIIGLACCLSAFGDRILGIASIYLAILTIVYNILAVITLTRHLESDNRKGFVNIFSQIAKNPLVLSITAGIFIAVLDIPIPEFALRTGDYFARMTLPLALLCAGAAIRIEEFQSSKTLYWASSLKLVFVPLIITAGGVLVGFRGEQLGVLYLMSASPTAAASFPMTQAMKGNYHLAAAIITVTSIGSLLFTTVGVFLLRVNNLM